MNRKILSVAFAIALCGPAFSQVENPPVSSVPVTSANPSATIGASAVNGTSSQFMRADAAPALPATLPALDGSALTNLNGAALTSGTVPAARMSAANQASFRATMSGDQSVSSGNVIQFNTKDWDTNTNFNVGTFTFTPTVAGKYTCAVTLDISGTATAGAEFTADLLKNGAGGTGTTATLVAGTVSGAAIGRLNMGGSLSMNGSTDAIVISMSWSGTASGISVKSANSSFGCFRQAS